jgi:hypothetical protein
LLTFVAVIFFLPVVLTNLGFQFLVRTVSVIANVLPEPGMGVVQMNTHCESKGDKVVEVHGYLKLVNESSYVITGDLLDAFVSQADSEGKSVVTHVGTGVDYETIVLTDSSFIPIQLTIRRSEDAAKLTDNRFGCYLAFRSLLLPIPEPVRRD